MQAGFDLHPLAIEDARHGHHRPKIEEYGDSLFAVLQMIESVDGESVRRACQQRPNSKHRSGRHLRIISNTNFDLSRASGGILLGDDDRSAQSGSKDKIT